MALGAGRKRIQGWIASLDKRLAAVEVDGEPAYILRDDLQGLAGTHPNAVVRLLPGYDQWVIGPGTADPHVVPRRRRTLLSRQASFVIIGGVVGATWSLTDDGVAIGWFGEGGSPPREALVEEVARLARILDRPLQMSVQNM